jgi:SAM-dependent methyltransferase
MLLSGNFCDVIISINKKFHLNYLDFGKAGIEKLGLDSREASPHQSSGAELDFILRGLTISPKDSIIDLGSGKGWALFLMSNYPFRRIVGVEISHDLTAIAKRNIRRLGRSGRIELVCSNAKDFSNLDDFNYIYLFNPFPGPVLLDVVENVRSSLQNNPRDLTIIYSNPKCEDVVLDSNLFQRTIEHCFENKDSIVIYSHRTKVSGERDRKVEKVRVVELGGSRGVCESSPTANRPRSSSFPLGVISRGWLRPSRSK